MGNCHNTIVVNASKQEVWDKIIDFHDLSWAPSVIEDVQVIGDKGGQEVGAQRLLNGAIRETLISMDPDTYTFTYTIDDGPGPLQKDSVESYVGKVTLADADNGTEVIWTSEFTAKDDDAVAVFCDPVYQGLLQDLAKQF